MQLKKKYRFLLAEHSKILGTLSVNHIKKGCLKCIYCEKAIVFSQSLQLLSGSSVLLLCTNSQLVVTTFWWAQNAKTRMPLGVLNNFANTLQVVKITRQTYITASLIGHVLLRYSKPHNLWPVVYSVTLLSWKQSCLHISIYALKIIVGVILFLSMHAQDCHIRSTYVQDLLSCKCINNILDKLYHCTWKKHAAVPEQQLVCMNILQ